MASPSSGLTGPVSGRSAAEAWGGSSRTCPPTSECAAPSRRRRPSRTGCGGGASPSTPRGPSRPWSAPERPSAQVDDDGHVIRRLVLGAGGLVHPATGQTPGQGLREERVVDAQASVAAKGARPVVPPAEVLPFGLDLPEGVDEPKGEDALQRRVLRRGEEELPLHALGLEDVALVAGDVEVAAQQQL